MIPTPDKLGLYYPSKDLTEAGTNLPERSIATGSTSMAIKTTSISQATGYWDGALGFFYGPTTQPELRGQTFHVRKWVKDEGCLYITSPLPIVPVDTDKFKVFAGGKYASTQEVFGLIVGGKQPEADNTVTGTNITGVTIKKASGMLGEGTLSIQFNAATKGISIKMNSGLYGPEEILSKNETIAVYNSDYSGFVLLEVVFSALKTSGTHTDTYVLTIPKNVLIPNYEGYETNTGKLVERFHLLALKNKSEASFDAMTALSLWTVKPEHLTATTTSDMSNNLYGQPGSITMNTNVNNWPTRGFWVYNRTSSYNAAFYVTYRNGQTLYLAPRSDGFFLFSYGTTHLQKGATIQWATGTANATVGTMIVTRVEIASGSLESGDARGICHFTKATGTGHSFGMGTGGEGNYYCYLTGTSTQVCRNYVNGQNYCVFRGWRPKFDVSPANLANLGTLIYNNRDRQIYSGHILEVWPDFDLGAVASTGLHADPPDEYTAPNGVAFQPYVDSTVPLIHDLLLGGDLLSLWIRQTIVDGTQARQNIIGNIRAMWY